MNKIRKFLNIIFTITFLGPAIGVGLISASLTFMQGVLGVELATLILIVGTIGGCVLCPLYPLTYNSTIFWMNVVASIEQKQISNVFLIEDIYIFACCNIILLLPIIGTLFVKTKPKLYRMFVYLPLLGSIVYNVFFNTIDIIIGKPFVTDAIYLLLAIALDISSIIERRRA